MRAASVCLIRNLHPALSCTIPYLLSFRAASMHSCTFSPTPLPTPLLHCTTPYFAHACANCFLSSELQAGIHVLFFLCIVSHHSLLLVFLNCMHSCTFSPTPLPTPLLHYTHYDDTTPYSAHACAQWCLVFPNCKQAFIYFFFFALSHTTPYFLPF